MRGNRQGVANFVILVLGIVASRVLFSAAFSFEKKVFVLVFVLLVALAMSEYALLSEELEEEAWKRRVFMDG